jgi:ABC-2 type transport system permease protein
MVAHLLRLRLIVLGNTLKRSTGQLVAVIIGGVYGLGMLGLAVAGLIALSFAPIEIARTVVILAGSATILGWIVLPLMVSGIDQTLEPAKLATFPIPINQLVVGLTVAGVAGIPGIITLLAALATVGTWWRNPLAAVAAVLCAVVAVLICVVGSRMVTAISAGLSSRRRFRELTGILIFIPLVLLGPIISSVTSGLRNGADALPGFAEALSWTPLGAIWAVPSELAEGNPGAAALKFAIGIFTLALVTLVWRHSLGIALTAPAHSSARRVGRGGLGLFGLFPGTPTGAVAARALSYWFRDPRYARSLIVVPLIPVLLFLNSRNADSLGVLNAAGPILALLLSLSIFTDISYDSTAFATHLSTGVRGVADRAGRVLALGTFALPLVIVFTVAAAGISSAWQNLPALLGLTLGVLLTGFGLSSVSSSRIVIPVPAPGDSPFKSPAGAGFTTALTTFATWGILIGLVIPELVLAIVSFVTGLAVFGWLTLAVGVVLGSVLLVVGIRIGGTQVDRRGPELLASLSRQR